MKNKGSRLRAALLGLVLAAGLAAGCSRDEAATGGGRTVRLAVAPDYPPYAYRHQGELTGIDVELGALIAQEAGGELRIVPGDFSELLELVRQGKADMAICALAVTAERREAAAFSDPYEFAGQTFLVRAGENIRYLTDMRGKEGFRIGAETGSTGFQLIDRFLGETRLPMRLIGYAGNREAVADLLEKRNDAVILDPLVARCLQMEHPEQLEILRDQLNHEEFAVAVARREPRLLAAANRVIHRLWRSGELRALQQKHIRQSMKRGENDAP